MIAAVATLLFGCANTLPRVSMLPTDDGFSAPESSEPTGLADDPPEPFVLRPGDVLRIRSVAIDPLDADRVEVDEAGCVNIPLAGSVAIGGMTLDAATRALETALRPYDRFVRVAITVAESHGHRVLVFGAVRNPGTFQVSISAHVADIIALAGGPQVETIDGEVVSIADLAGARVIRRGEALPISVGRALEGDLRHNVRIHAGDMVQVPPAQGRRVLILGQVRNPRVLPFRPGLRLTDTITLAGGVTENADESDVRVVRGPLSAPRIYRASLSDIFSGRATDVVLARGDIVYVTESWAATVLQVVQRLSPLITAGTLAATLAR